MIANPSVQQPQSQMASAERHGAAGGRGELGSGRWDRYQCWCMLISFGVCSFVHGSAHCSGCVVDGPSTMAAT